MQLLKCVLCRGLQTVLQENDKFGAIDNCTNSTVFPKPQQAKMPRSKIMQLQVDMQFPESCQYYL